MKHTFSGAVYTKNEEKGINRACLKNKRKKRERENENEKKASFTN
jgi:hypothetical protein